jgi:hypothetical protein
MGNNNSIPARYFLHTDVLTDGKTPISKDYASACRGGLGTLYNFTSLKKKRENNDIVQYTGITNLYIYNQIIIANTSQKIAFLQQLKHLPSSELVIVDYHLVGIYDKIIDEYLPIEKYYDYSTTQKKTQYGSLSSYRV